MAIQRTNSTHRSAAPVAAGDPLRPTAPDGWSPDRIVAVRSRHQGGFVGSALQFALGGVREQPGQRLSVAQVDQLAPYFATVFGLDEGYVRSELAKVYLYVGGPSTGSQAMTIGHHLFLPDEAALQRILQKHGRRWLVHELAHTMQFLAYQDGSPHRFLADYFSSMVVGRDPQQPGSGDGPPVWGALFTGLRTVGRTEESIGAGADGARERLTSTLVPAATVGLPLALAGGGALAAGRATTGRRLLGTGPAMGTAFGTIAAPALLGSLVGAHGHHLPEHAPGILGGALGAAVGGLTLLRGGAFAAGGATAGTEVGRALGRGSAVAAAVSMTVAAAAIGALSATASANTVRGWSRSADVLHSLHHRHDGESPPTLDYDSAVHDAHWIEIDAEAVARRFTTGDWERPAPGERVAGTIPSAPDGLRERIDGDLSDRIDWGLKVPLILGLPAAAAVGTGVLSWRTGRTLFDATVREGRGPAEAIGAALAQLGSKHLGVGNSLGVGAATTVAPLIAGGVAGPIAYSTTGSTLVARTAGAGAGAVATGALLTLLLRGRGAGAVATSAKVAAGMAVGGALGLLSGGVATDALRPHDRRYDTTGPGT